MCYKRVLKSDTELTGVCLLTVVIVAALFMFYGLGHLPPGLASDEATAGLDALDTLRSGPQLIYERQAGGGSLLVYTLAIAFAIVGPSIMALRVVVGVFGVLHAVALFLFYREFLREPWGEGSGLWGATLATLLVISSVWYLQVFRLAWSPTTSLALVGFCFYFLWRGLRRGQRRDFVLSGLVAGLAGYEYLSVRLLPVIIAIFLALDVVLTLVWRERVSLWRQHQTNILWLFGTVIITLVPWGIYNLRYPKNLLGRPVYVSVLNPNINQDGPFQALGRGIGQVLDGLGFTPGAWQTVTNRLLFDPITTALFIVGLVAGLRFITRPRYLFLYVGLGLAFVPSILAPGTFLHFVRRAVLALPLMPIFVILALFTADGGLRRYVKRVGVQKTGRTLLWFISFAVVSFLAWQGFVSYFNVLLRQPAVVSLFNPHVIQLVEDMREASQADSTYVILLNHIRPSFYEHTVVDFLYQGKADYFYLLDDEATAFRELAPHFEKKDTIHLVRLSKVGRAGVDGKGYIDYLLERWGRVVANQSTPYYTIETYQRDPTSILALDAPLPPTSVIFGEKWQLIGASYGDASNSTGQARQVPAGKQLWVDLLWKKIAPDAKNYQVVVWLEDATGHRLSGLDKLLLSNDQQPSGQWDVDQFEHSYYLLSVPASALPGDYTLKTAIYQATTGQRLPPQQPGIGADLALPLGSVVVQPPQRALTSSLPAGLLPLDAVVGSGLRLVGLEGVPEEPLNPGDQLWVALYWQAEDEIRPDYQLALRLVSGQETQTLLLAQTIGGEMYSTSRWPPTHILKQWIGGYLPAALQGGTYRLIAEVQADDTNQTTRLDLSAVEVQARPRHFELPSIQQPMRVALANNITFLGFETNVLAFHPGDAVTISLYWQADRAVETSYVTFVHVVDDQGQIIAQQDQMPQQGQAPTTGWLPGEIVSDSKTILLPSEMLEGTYQVQVGMYDPRTGQRLHLVGQTADAISLGQIRVQ